MVRTFCFAKCGLYPSHRIYLSDSLVKQINKDKKICEQTKSIRTFNFMMTDLFHYHYFPHFRHLRLFQHQGIIF